MHTYKVLNLTASKKIIAPSRQGRKVKFFLIFSELGMLCVFARVILSPIPKFETQRKIANILPRFPLPPILDGPSALVGETHRELW